MNHSYCKGIRIASIHTITPDEPINVEEITHIQKMEALFCLECEKKKCNGNCKSYRDFKNLITKFVKEEPKSDDEFYDLFYRYSDYVRGI